MKVGFDLFGLIYFHVHLIALQCDFIVDFVG